MSTKEKINLAFECEQEWEDMRPTQCGRYCKLCKKEVLDFTNKSYAEISKYKEEKGELCGQFRIEQVEDGLIEAELPFYRKIRYYAAAFATLIGIETAQAGAKGWNAPGIELVANASAAYDEPGPGDHPTGRDSRKKKKVKLSDKKVKGSKEVRKKKKIYFSKRFPFIVRKKRTVRGRMRF